MKTKATNPQMTTHGEQTPDEKTLVLQAVEFCSSAFDEVHHPRRPANQLPRFETRGQWPYPRPRTLVKGQPGVQLILDVCNHGGQKHLTIVSPRLAA